MTCGKCHFAPGELASLRRTSAVAAELASTPEQASAETAPAPQTIPFTDGVPRCTTCHRAGHQPGNWQGHHFTTITRQELADAAAAERRIATRGGRTGRLTGYRDHDGNPYVAFDDGSEYAVRFDAIVSIEPDPEIAEADGVLYLTDDGQRTALTAGVRVATSPRGWGTIAADPAPVGYVAVLFDGADYPIPVAAGGLLTAVQPEPTAATATVDITITRAPLASATPGRRSASWIYSYVSPVRQELPRGDGDPYVIEVGQSVEHGTNLTALRDMLRRKFGKFSRTHLAWCS